MCRPASIVMTKDRDFWSMKTDSHSEIIKEFGLCESIRNKSDATAEACLVKVELTPPNNDFAAPLKMWRFKIDQDIVPKWFDPKKHEARARETLKQWVTARVFKSGKHEVREGSFFACGSAQVTAYDSSKVTAYDSSKVTACNSSKVTAYGSSKVTACNSSKVTAYGSSKVTAYGSSQITAFGSSKVTAYESSKVTAYDNSTVTAYGSSAVTTYGSSTIVSWNNKSGIYIRKRSLHRPIER